MLYFYSTNVEYKKCDWIDPNRIYYGYRSMNWSKYLVWDEWQEEFIRKAVSSCPVTSIVGPVWFSDSVEEGIGDKVTGIAVFDIQPVRDSLYFTSAVEFDYYRPVVMKKFLEDIHDVFSTAGLTITLKRKRNTGNLVHSAYSKMLESFREKERFVVADPDENAIKLIRGSIASISLPFSSTALLAAYEGKPSIYYDPTGVIAIDDPGAHSVKIISGKAALKEWSAKIIDDHCMGKLHA